MKNKQFPLRPDSHALETKSINYFKKNIPQEWSVNRLENDYGIDLFIEIPQDSQMTGLDLIVQLKSSQTSNPSKTYVPLRLSVSTYNYLRKKRAVVLLVKYIADIEQAFCILMVNVDCPKKKTQKSFVIRVPIENNIASFDWNEIAGYV